MKKTAFFLSLLLLPTLAGAADILPLSDEQQRRQVEENINKLGQEISKNIHEAGKQLTDAIPTITNNLSTILNSLTSEIIPVMQALEENRKLIEASDTMAQALEQSLPAQYRQELKYEIDSANNQLSVDGNIFENQDSIRYNIIRNLAAATVTQNLITQTNEVENANFFQPGSAKLPTNKQLYDLDNQQIPHNLFKLELIQNNAFMVYENPEQQKTFIFGNLNPVLMLRVQSHGPNHDKKIREFIKNLDLPKMNNAVSYIQEEEEDLNLTLYSPTTQK